MADVHEESLWNTELEDFKKINDIALPMCYLSKLKLVDILPTATVYIGETWVFLCKMLELDPEGEYKNSKDMLRKSPLFNKEVDES